VGFDLYCKLLEESVSSLKNQIEKSETEVLPERYTDPKLDVDFDLMIPHDYIFSEMERITIYHRMVNFRSLDDLESIKDELKDRFGPVPEVIIRLIDAIELKILAGKIYASRVSVKDKSLRIDFADLAREDDHFFKNILPVFMNAKKTEVRFLGDADKLGVQLQLRGKDKIEQLSFAKNLLNSFN